MDEEKDKNQSEDTEKVEETEEVEETESVEESEKPTPVAFSTPYYAKEKKKSGKLIYFLIVIIILLASGGYYIYSQYFTSGGEVKTSESPTPTPAPTETPAPALDKSEWSLEVLNGSGVSGAAKKIANQLTELGYTVVKTGNADKDTYTESQILVKDDLKDKIDLVIADLKDVIKIASVAGELKDSTASARIIIGKD